MADGEKGEFLIVTGMSGAGRTTVANALEDLGWYVVDNLPPQILRPLLDLTDMGGTALPKVAAVVDVRGRNLFDDFPGVARALRSRGSVRVLFLDASDAVLIRRFESNRRSHPLQNDGQDGTLTEGITAERLRLAQVKAAADLTVDTTSLSVHQLRRKIETVFGDADTTGVGVTVQSFGFKYGLPMDADLVCDVRFLPNPHWVPELREHTGQDADVRDYVLGQDGARDYLQTYTHLLNLTIEGYVREGKRYMTVAVGCTGGKHRSVAMTEALAAILADQGDVSVRVLHRDLGRE